MARHSGCGGHRTESGASMIKIAGGIIAAILIFGMGCQQPDPQPPIKAGHVYEVDENGRLIDMGPMDKYYTR